MSSATTLYTIPLSHPAYTARLMLEHKGIEYRVVELLSGFHPLLLRALGFRAGTVPALRLDGRRVQGTLRISRALEETVPEPPLHPAEPERRRRVLEAEAWGERELQPIPRRILRWALNRDARLRRTLAELNGLPLLPLAGVAVKPVAAVFARLSRAYNDRVRHDLARLPGLLDRVDALIAEGVLGGPESNAADFQIAPTLRLMLACEDLRTLVRDRPAEDLALRLLPTYPGHVHAIVPPEWLPRAASAAR